MMLTYIQLCTYALCSCALCPARSTLVERALQIHPFLCKTNPILKSHPAISVDIKKHYENISNWTLGENEPKTNPIYRGVASGEAGNHRSPAPAEAGINEISKKAKMNVTNLLTNSYEQRTTNDEQ